MRVAICALLALMFMGANLPQFPVEQPPGIEIPAQEPDDQDDYPYNYAPDWVEKGVEVETDKLTPPTDDPNVEVTVTVLWYGVSCHTKGCMSEFNECDCPECLNWCCDAPGHIMYKVEFKSITPLGVSFYKTFGMIDQRVDRTGYESDAYPTTNTWKCRGKTGTTECPYEAIREMTEEFVGHEVNEVKITWIGVEE